MEHFKLQFIARVPGGIFTNGRTFQYYDSFKARGLGSPILAVHPRVVDPELVQVAADIEMFPNANNRVHITASGQPALEMQLDDRDRETIEEVSKLIRRILGDLGATDVVAVPGDHGALHWLCHHLGTCRMGDDPATSVADADLRVHGSRNLYIAGSAAFVTGGGANPTLTIVALSHRLAAHLDAELGAA